MLLPRYLMPRARQRKRQPHQQQHSVQQSAKPNCIAVTVQPCSVTMTHGCRACWQRRAAAAAVAHQWQQLQQPGVLAPSSTAAAAHKQHLSWAAGLAACRALCVRTAACQGMSATWRLLLACHQAVQDEMQILNDMTGSRSCWRTVGWVPACRGCCLPSHLHRALALPCLVRWGRQCWAHVSV